MVSVWTRKSEVRLSDFSLRVQGSRCDCPWKRVNRHEKVRSLLMLWSHVLWLSEGKHEWSGDRVLSRTVITSPISLSRTPPTPSSTWWSSRSLVSGPLLLSWPQAWVEIRRISGKKVQRRKGVWGGVWLEVGEASTCSGGTDGV